MVDIYGSHFEYGGVSSETRGIVLANVETERFRQVAGTISGVTIFNKGDKVNYLIDDDYSGSPLSFDVDIVTDDERILSSSERRTLERWLFNRHNYKKLYIRGNADCDYVGATTVQQYEKKVSGSVAGISNVSLSVESGTPLALRVYFTLESGYTPSDFTYTIDGETMYHTASPSTTYYFRISNIYPDKYDEWHTVTATDGTNTTTIKACVLSYVYTALSSRTASAATKATAVDLYRAFKANDGTCEYIDGVAKYLYMNCRFTNPSYLEYQGGVVGYRATLETDCGYWWQDEITKTFEVNHTAGTDATTITIDVDTDIDDYTYPEVRVTMNSSGGGFSITNQTDSGTRSTVFSDITAGATVTTRGGVNYVSGQYYEKFYLQNFVRLLPGSNTLTVRGNVASIRFTFNNRRNL